MRTFFSPVLLASLLVACGDSDGNPIIAGSGDSGAATDSAAKTDAAQSDSESDSGGLTDSAPPTDASQVDVSAEASTDGGPASASLAVASTNGVLVWKNAASITTNVAPDVTNAGVATAITAAGGRLYVGRAVSAGSTPLVTTFDAASLTSSSAPTASIHRTGAPTILRVDGADRLWLDDAENNNSVHMFTGASALTSTSTPAVSFSHVNQQVPAFAYDGAGDRLFAGQISGSGVLAWNAASTLTGSPTFNFQVSAGTYFTMQIAGDRLYAAGTHGDSTVGVAIWAGVSALSTATAPVLVKTGYQTGKYISDVTVREDVLAVAARDQNTIFIYTHASAIAADRAADFTITDPTMNAPSRIALDGAGRLYAVDKDSVLVFSNVTTAPTLVTEITTGVGTPVDVTLIE